MIAAHPSLILAIRKGWWQAQPRFQFVGEALDGSGLGGALGGLHVSVHRDEAGK